ncbi:hypothetical protein C8Q74DRAFT_1257868 [Fomes fomentarius]|nr:hypothetical protein C8Q74DRAFT_1257868 [Fomes fomentarius]
MFVGRFILVYIFMSAWGYIKLIHPVRAVLTPTGVSDYMPLVIDLAASTHPRSKTGCTLLRCRSEVVTRTSAARSSWCIAFAYVSVISVSPEPSRADGLWKRICQRVVGSLNGYRTA